MSARKPCWQCGDAWARELCDRHRPVPRIVTRPSPPRNRGEITHLAESQIASKAVCGKRGDRLRFASTPTCHICLRIQSSFVTPVTPKLADLVEPQAVGDHCFLVRERVAERESRLGIFVRIAGAP